LLARKGIAIEARDIFKQPLTEAEITGLLASIAWEDLFSWRSPTARARGIAPGSINAAEAVRMMAAEPRLIRRPVIRVGERIIVGTDMSAIAALA
jgi:arsenate reductase-like glutaredoxin family protein